MSESSEEIKKNFEPDWKKVCHVCQETPVVPVSGLCGPCHFGTVDALSGDWWDPVTEDINPDNIGGLKWKDSQ